METPAEDYEMNETITISTKREDLIETKKMLEKAGYTLLEASVGYRAKNFVPLSDFDHALKLYSMLEAFDEDEDVETVWNTADIPEELWKEVEAYVASRRFRT